MEDKYLQEGKQTTISKEIAELARSIEGEGLDYIFNVLVWLREYFNNGKNHATNVGIDFKSVLMGRSADEIYKSNYHAGCTDYTLLFVTIMRSKKIPTKYVEVIAEEWLNSKDTGSEDKIKGHSYGECYLDGKWFSVDATNGSINVYKAYRHFKIFGKGLDCYDLGIYGYDSMKKQFLEFKKKYIESKE